MTPLFIRGQFYDIRFNIMEFFSKIPVMDRDALREFKKGIDFSFKNFSREYGDAIEGFLIHFLLF